MSFALPTFTEKQLERFSLDNHKSQQELAHLFFLWLIGKLNEPKTLTISLHGAFFIAMNFTQSTAVQNIFHKTLRKLWISILASIFLFSFSKLSAKEDTFSQLEAIEKRLAALELENVKLKERISELEKGGAQENAKQLPGLIPEDETKKKAFFDRFRREFKSSQDQTRGPWTSPEPWTKIRKRMSEYSVREILGRPTRMRPSVKPHVEMVYLYAGDLNSDGVDEEGFVELKDKRVVSFKSPHTSE